MDDPLYSWSCYLKMFVAMIWNVGFPFASAYVLFILQLFDTWVKDKTYGCRLFPLCGKKLQCRYFKV